MKLREIAASIGAEIRGNGDAAVTRVASIALADADSLVFAEDETALREALDSQAAAVLVTAELSRQAGEAKPLLVMRQPRLGFARAAQLLRSSERKSGVHPAALVASTAVLDEDVFVDAYAVIEDGAEIGAGSNIGAGSV